MTDEAVAKTNVVSAQAELSSAETNLGKAIITSPIDGVVLNRAVEPGQTVSASFSAPTLFTLAEDLSKMELEVSVDEADVGQVRGGQDAEFTVDAWPGRNSPAQVTRVCLGSTVTSNPDAIIPDDPRHCHWRIGCDHHGYARQRRNSGDKTTGFKPGQ